MFNFLNRKNPAKCSVPEDRRQWIDQVFLWLFDTFGKENVINQKIFVPDKTDFPFQYDESTESINKILKIVATQMQIAVDDIHLDFYTYGPRQINTGGRFLEDGETEPYSAGVYWGRQEDGKYHIGLENKTLASLEKVVATLAHEIAHIKLLEEVKIEENDEEITDFTTLALALVFLMPMLP